MATKPKRSDFGAGRQGAARYQQAMRTWSSSQSSTKTTNKAPGTGRSRAQRSRTTPAKATPAKPQTRGMSNIPPKEGRPGSPSYVKPRPTTTTTRRNVTPTPPTAPKKPTVTTPAKPAALKPRTWLKENYKPGGPPKKAVTPKKKKLTNKQRKQGGFH